MADDKLQDMINWKFDNYNCSEKADNNEIIFSESENYPKNQIAIIANGKTELIIEAYRDQWGTWITFNSGVSNFTIAQEDCTRSFMSGLIEALTELKKITDIMTESPTKWERLNEKIPISGIDTIGHNDGYRD